MNFRVCLFGAMLAAATTTKAMVRPRRQPELPRSHSHWIRVRRRGPPLRFGRGQAAGRNRAFAVALYDETDVCTVRLEQLC